MVVVLALTLLVLVLLEERYSNIGGNGAVTAGAGADAEWGRIGRC